MLSQNKHCMKLRVLFLYNHCTYTYLIMPRPHRVGALNVDGRRLSVRLSDPCLILRMEGRSKLKIVKKEAHDTVTLGHIYRSKGQRSRSSGRSGWLLKSPLAGGGGTYCGSRTAIGYAPPPSSALHYRPHSLCCIRPADLVLLAYCIVNYITHLNLPYLAILSHIISTEYTYQ